MVAPNICGCSVWNLSQANLLAPRILEWLLYFLENLSSSALWGMHCWGGMHTTWSPWVANGWHGRQLSMLNTYIAGCQKNRPSEVRLCRGRYNSAHAWAWYFLQPLYLAVYLALFTAYVTKPSYASRLWQNRTELWHEQRIQDRFCWTQHSAGLLSIPYCNTSFVKRSATMWRLL